MLQCIINIKLVQVNPYIDGNGKSYPRRGTYTIDFCNSFEVYSSWKSLCDTATIELPKNLYISDDTGNPVILGESATPGKVRGYVNAGGFINKQVAGPPVFMRGDEVTVTAGYSYISQVNADGSLKYATTTNTIFSGFISSVESKSTLKIHCEDFMWLLKQTTMQPKTYYAPGNDISNVLADIVANVNAQYNRYPISYDTDEFKLSVDGLGIGNETAADVLNKLKQILPSMAFYFRNGVLRGGGIVYFPQDQSTGTGPDGKPAYHTFNFQANIISDALHYTLQKDVKVAAICYSVNSIQKSITNKMGATQYHTCRLQATVGDNMPANKIAEDYEYYNFYFKDVSDENTLMANGQTYLARYQYDGFRGSFNTFGLPFVEHGNIVYVTDTLLPERNGHYMVKGVNYSYGVNSGLRQDVELHFRTDNVAPDILAQGM